MNHETTESTHDFLSTSWLARLENNLQRLIADQSPRAVGDFTVCETYTGQGNTVTAIWFGVSDGQATSGLGELPVADVTITASYECGERLASLGMGTDGFRDEVAKRTKNGELNTWSSPNLPSGTWRLLSALHNAMLPN